MLFSADARPGIADGFITVTFRTWTRAHAKTGGRYRVAGMLIEARVVAQVLSRDITEADARKAGSPDLLALRSRLGDPAPEALVWRIDFRYVGRDDRSERGEIDVLSTIELTSIRNRLTRPDRSGRGRLWTLGTLQLIERYPGVVSTVLAKHARRDRASFKLDVRKLKELGLTESLDIGYRLTARGVAVLRDLS